MDDNTVKEGHLEHTGSEDSEQNGEMPSQSDETLSSIPSSAPATPKADKTSKSTLILK